MNIGDPERLAALERSGLLRHDDYDRLTRLCYTATELLDADAAQINVITDSQQVFLAEWPRTVRPPAALSSSGCRQVVLRGELVAVEDTLKDPVLCTMPWVASWRGYMGVPLTFEGQVLGSMCVLTVKQRPWSMMDRVALEGLGDMVEGAIKLGLA